MKEDLVDDGAPLSLPGISAPQFNLLKTKIIDKKSKAFQQLCSGPIAKDLVEMLHVADVLEISALQDVLVDELAQRYYNFPSLARRHTDCKYLKYIPQFTHSDVEKVLAQKIVMLSQQAKRIDHVADISNQVTQAWLTPDGKHIIGKVSKRYEPGSWQDFAVWSALTGELCEKLVPKEFYCVATPVVNTQGAYMLTWDGHDPSDHHYLKNLKEETITTLSKDTLFYLYTINATHITPNNSILIGSEWNAIDIREQPTNKDKKSWGKTCLEVNPSPLNKGYEVTFENNSLMTKDGKYLIFKYRLGIKKLNLETHDIECFDFLKLYAKNDEVSAIALTPDESKIIVGICRSTCRTKLKLLDFVTGKVIKNIPINTQCH